MDGWQCLPWLTTAAKSVSHALLLRSTTPFSPCLFQFQISTPPAASDSRRRGVRAGGRTTGRDAAVPPNPDHPHPPPPPSPHRGHRFVLFLAGGRHPGPICREKGTLLLLLPVDTCYLLPFLESGTPVAFLWIGSLVLLSFLSAFFEITKTRTLFFFIMSR